MGLNCHLVLISLLTIRGEYSAAHKKDLSPRVFIHVHICIAQAGILNRMRHQGLMSVRRRNRPGLLIQQTLSLHKINKRKSSVGEVTSPGARRAPPRCSAPPPLDVLVAPAQVARRSHLSSPSLLQVGAAGRPTQSSSFLLTVGVHRAAHRDWYP